MADDEGTAMSSPLLAASPPLPLPPSPPSPRIASRKRTVSALGLAAFSYMLICAGPYGIEDTVSAAGPFPVLVAIALIPIVWGLPQVRACVCVCVCACCMHVCFMCGCVCARSVRVSAPEFVCVLSLPRVVSVCATAFTHSTRGSPGRLSRRQSYQRSWT